MDLYLLKFPYRRMLLPLAKKLKCINPDILGYLAVFAALVTALCYVFAEIFPALLISSVILTLLRMTLNTIDGVIAIERGNLRLKGEIVNALPDRYSDVFILTGIIMSGLCSTFLGVLAMASMFLVSYTGMLSKAVGASWQHHGPLGKVERLILIMIFSILEYFRLTGKISDFYGITYFNWLVILFIVLGQITVFNRLKAQLRECRKLDWIKYRNLNKKTAVVYDSMTGNTQKAAAEAADALQCPLLSAKDAMNADFSDYDLVILAFPHMGRKITSLNMLSFLEINHNIKKYALLMTSGMPVKRIFSNKKCINYVQSKLNQKPIDAVNLKGYHTIAETYKNQPDSDELLSAYLFAAKLYERI